MSLNSDTVLALANYIIAQTKLAGYRQFKQLLVDRASKLTEPSQLHVRHLVIDDCGMKDEDFAVLLGAISMQGKLRTLTYNRNEFGRKSLLALSEILGSTYQAEAAPLLEAGASVKPKATRAGYLDQIKLINVSCEKQVTCRLLEELDACVESKPLT